MCQEWRWDNTHYCRYFLVLGWIYGAFAEVYRWIERIYDEPTEWNTQKTINQIPIFRLLRILLLPISMCNFPLPIDCIDILSFVFNSWLARCRLVIDLVIFNIAIGLLALNLLTTIINCHSNAGHGCLRRKWWYVIANNCDVIQIQLMHSVAPACLLILAWKSSSSLSLKPHWGQTYKVPAKTLGSSASSITTTTARVHQINWLKHELRSHKIQWRLFPSDLPEDLKDSRPDPLRKTTSR